MQRRFTIIQGGLGETSRMPPGPTFLPESWRVVLLRVRSVGEREMADWRALTERQPGPDPFADPDFLMTAARHGASGREIALAFAYGRNAAGAHALGGVLPLELPHSVLGGTVRLWHPPLAPRAVEPVIERGAESSVVEAVIAELRGHSSRWRLHLGSLAAAGRILRALRTDERLRLTDIARPESIPADSFVEIHPRKPAPEIERVTEPGHIRDAVERFLLIEAQRSRRPLLGNPSDTAMVRVATRLLAHRGMACVDLGRVGGAIVSGAIRLGLGEDRVLWRSADTYDAETAEGSTVDVDVDLAGISVSLRSPLLKLVAP